MYLHNQLEAPSNLPPRPTHPISAVLLEVIHFPHWYGLQTHGFTGEGRLLNEDRREVILPEMRELPGAASGHATASFEETKALGLQP